MILSHNPFWESFLHCALSDWDHVRLPCNMIRVCVFPLPLFCKLNFRNLTVAISCLYSGYFVTGMSAPLCPCTTYYYYRVYNPFIQPYNYIVGMIHCNGENSVIFLIDEFLLICLIPLLPSLAALSEYFRVSLQNLVVTQSQNVYFMSGGRLVGRLGSEGPLIVLCT